MNTTHRHDPESPSILENCNFRFKGDIFILDFNSISNATQFWLDRKLYLKTLEMFGIEKFEVHTFGVQHFPQFQVSTLLNLPDILRGR